LGKEARRFEAIQDWIARNETAGIDRQPRQQNPRRRILSLPAPQPATNG
jgi:hypothetical protein